MTATTQSTRQTTTWEDEGGYLGMPIRLQPRRLRRWWRWGAALGAALERGWSKLWIYNPTRWTLARTAGVFVTLLFLLLFFALAILPMLVMMPVVAALVIPMVLVTFLLR